MARRPRLSSTPRADFVAATCDGKPAFESFQLASQVAERRRRRREGKVQPYRCPFCHRWHIGSKPPGRRHKSKESL